MPTTGFFPRAARYSLASFPLAQTGIKPMPPLAVSEERIGHFTHPAHIEQVQRPTARVGDETRPRTDGTNLVVPLFPQRKQAILAPANIFAPGRIAGTRSEWKLQPAGFLKILLAVGAVADSRSIPAVGKNPVGLVTGHDFLVDLRHVLKAVRS